MDHHQTKRVRVRCSVGDEVREIEFHTPRTDIGSHFSSTFAFDDAGLEPRHASFRSSARGLSVQKYRAFNQVLVNGVVMLNSQRMLTPGDIVRMGSVTFEILRIGNQQGPRELLHADEWIQHVAERAAHLAPHTERVGETLVTRLQHRCRGDVVQSTLTLSISILRGREFFLDAQVPPADTPISLRKQRRFLVGFFQTLGELEIGDKELDDAFYIDAPVESTELLKALSQSFRALMGCELSLELKGETLKIKLSKVPTGLQPLQPLLSLWTTSCDFHSGFWVSHET